MGTSDFDLAAELQKNGSLAMMVAQPPIAFHRVFVDLTGSATAALLLSACLEQQEVPGAMNEHGWMEVSAQGWEDRTGLSRKEQATARKTLRELGLFEEHRTGYPAKFEIRVNFERISQLLIATARKRMVPKKPLPVH
jgi:hypothetical protein